MADGWIPIFFSVDSWEEAWGEHLEAGFAKGGRSREDLSISPSVQVAIDGDLDTARAMVKMGLVLYLGGMGSKEKNFYVDLATRFGFGEAADEVRDLFLDGKKEEAFQALPDELVDATSLVGTADEVAERVRAFAGSGVDRLIATPVQVTHEERVHTLTKLQEMVGAGAPA
jgi:alkanesulfonate monooxygenase SsuD/methylene tetrahydromethanopterin reductase-like flavin-dependent oxidoreductase (luciferase family)